MSLTYNTEIVSKAITWANALDRPLFLLILGTRPCYIKLAALVHALNDGDVPFLLIESGQHYDKNLILAKREFGYESLVGVTLNVRGSLWELPGQMFDRVGQLAKLISNLKPKHPPIPIVSGDTITAAYFPQAWYLRYGVRSVHVEAGLRTFGPARRDIFAEDCYRADLQRSVRWVPILDEPFPEGMCSRMASQASRLLLAPVDRNRASLLSEGFSKDIVEVVGSLSADAVVLPPREEVGGIPEACGKGEWIRVDLHRRENMTAERLDAVFGAIELLGKKGLRTLLILSNALVGALDRFTLWPALDRMARCGCLVQEAWTSYRSVVNFFSSGNCLATYTDSGGVQEETCVLGLPCFTCRFGTDRIETVLDFKSNLLVPPATAAGIAAGLVAGLSLTSPTTAKVGGTNPYGTNVAARIASILKTIHPQPVLPGAMATFRG